MASFIMKNLEYINTADGVDDSFKYLHICIRFLSAPEKRFLKHATTFPNPLSYVNLHE
ncbi:hypothetical protein Smp_181300 [Schistosoma mansoni]|uniref:hypothetical protein n=1 Tax=Schistosoma mansoni TaxID=6183 RepID=UPI0001A62ED3|nr:hypothetical protein Smp_181300 [Schistosoma mansoni]|eukprot:XP_018651034.1 hypothetical protein Smp_181300 [Schistosoma mansoni]